LKSENLDSTKLKQIPLGKQGMMSSEQGLGCMSFGMIMPTGFDL